MIVKSKKIFHTELKDLHLKKLRLKLCNNFDVLETNDYSFKCRINIILDILKMTYNNYDLFPYKVKLILYDKCLIMKDECKYKIKENSCNKNPWYKKHNKTLENIIELCDKIAN